MVYALKWENNEDGANDIESAPPSSDGVKLKSSEFISERRAYEAEISELSDTCNALRDELRIKEESAADNHR